MCTAFRRKCSPAFPKDCCIVLTQRDDERRMYPAKRPVPGSGVAALSLDELVVLVLILLAAGFLRLTGVNWDQGTHLHPDERFLTMVAADIRMADSIAAYFDTARDLPLNPANVGRPFFVYGTLPLFLVRSVAEERA